MKKLVKFESAKIKEGGMSKVYGGLIITTNGGVNLRKPVNTANGIPSWLHCPDLYIGGELVYL